MIGQVLLRPMPVVIVWYTRESKCHDNWAESPLTNFDRDYKCAGSSLAVSSAGVAYVIRVLSCGKFCMLIQTCRNLYPVGFDNKVSSYRCGA
jgi:hypothetical protein